MSNYTFKPRAQLLLQLGEQLIKNESVALIELIKNSYDADASCVNVQMNDINSPLLGEIIIEDDGFGMTKDIIENVWLEPGNTHKKNMIEDGQRTPKGRLPIGEKGIGRFGVHKLGSKITLITRAKESAEILLEMDWNEFIDAQYLNDVKINITERTPKIFTGEKTGTKIIIKQLRQSWKYSAFKQICRAINNLNSPFEQKDGFNVNLKCNLDGWGNDIITFDKIREYALFHFKSLISQAGEIKYEYKFRPFSAMENISERTVNNCELAVNSKNERIVQLNDEGKPINKVGSFSFEVYAFDRDAETVKKYIYDDKKSYKQYLDENGGIYVFRDGLRIYDYGERGNDWLQLDIKRVNRPGETLSNNLLIGAVQLKRDESGDLIEKANREGFIENDAFETLKRLLERCLEIFLAERNIDKEKYRSLKPAKEPVLSQLNKLKQIIEKSSATNEEKQVMTKYIGIIDKEYDYIKTITLTTASAGLTYGAVIHEIEKIIKELVAEVNDDIGLFKMKDKIMHLSDTIENYANLLRERKTSNSSLLSMAKRAIINCTYRFKAHKINCIVLEETFTEDIVNCSVNLIIGSIMNLFDNSIWWLENAGHTEKNIMIAMSKSLNGYNTLIVADDGTGFTIAPEDAIKPFVSKKPGGMGVGLNLVNEIMESHKGMLVFPSLDEIADINIGKFNAKAIVGLAFKK